MSKVTRPSEDAMSSMQRFARALWLLQVIAMAIGLATLPNVANSRQPDAAVAAHPIVSLQFDDASGVLWKATPRALARSLNEGRTWQRVRLPASAQDGIASLAIPAGGGKTIYVATAGSGVLRSGDSGRTWQERNRGLPKDDVIALAAHSTQPRTVFAYVAHKGIFRSTNAGLTWQFFNRGPADRLVQFAHSNMPSKTGTGWLFAATSKGVRRAMTCHCKWQSAGQLSISFRTVANDAALPARIYAAARDGLFISPDGGDHWTRMRSPVAPITALESTSSGRLYGAINGKLIRSINRGVTWEFVAE